MSINKLAKEIHEIAKSKGFWDTDRNVGELLMLCVSELGEALEAHRDPKLINISSNERIDAVQYCKTPEIFKEKFEYYIKDSFYDELADTIIRILDMCAAFNIDIESHIRLKLEYNKTRKRLHGKKY